MVINEKLTTGSMKDFIVETGTDGIWGYRKWNSGVSECWFLETQLHQFSSTTAWGSLYESPSTFFTYPTGMFIAEPQTTCTKAGGAGGWLEIGGGGTATRTPSLYVIYPTAKTTSTNSYISVYAIGRWK